nr:TraM recognition domain-containing protein [Chitinophaga solisilvae]
MNRLIKLVNPKGESPLKSIFDEFPTIYIRGSTGINILLATVRSNLVATTLALQNTEQLRKDYGKEQADVIINIVGNIIFRPST